MSNFFSKLDASYNWFNDTVYKYLLFLYYLNKLTKPLYAFFLGLLAGLAFPPLNLWILLPFAFTSVIRMTDFCETKIQSYFVGFWFSLGFYFVGLYWVSFALLHDKAFMWLFPLALFGVPIILALVNALLFPIYLHIVQFSSAIRKIFVFVALWVVFEYLKGFTLFQFPWAFLGYAFTNSQSILQVTSVIGVLGLSFIGVLWASSFHILMLTGDKEDFVKYFKFLLFNNILLLLLFIFGFFRVETYKSASYDDIKFRIVQGNSKAGEGVMWDNDPNLEKYIQLTTSKSLKGIDYIIWPEGSINSLVFNDEAKRKKIANLLTGEQILVTGAIRVEELPRGYKVYNSMIFIDSQNKAEFYDKNFLVPFGEFIPFKSLIPLKAIVGQDFDRGVGMQTMKISEKIPPFAPLICYEIAFSGQAFNYKNLNPEWILNITNDAWYLRSSGPFQHLQIARVRGLEEGLPIIRASNNGISAVFSGTGELLAKTSLFKEEVLDFPLPKNPIGRTIFSMLGNIPLLSMLLGFLAFCIIEFFYILNDKALNQVGYNFSTRNKKKP